MIRVLIPARGGSKRIPHKNLLNVGGHSLVGRAIVTGQKITSEVWVSTDSDDIKLESLKYSSYIHSRKPEHATDHSPTVDVITDFLSEHRDTSILVLLQCTTPYTSYTDVVDAISAVQSGKYKSSISVHEERGFYWNELDGVGIPYYDVRSKPRTQDMIPTYKETGGFYVFNTSEFKNHKLITPPPTKLINVDLKSSFDIDTQEEYELVNSIK